jgi:SAM-dependent methyltransferase
MSNPRCRACDAVEVRLVGRLPDTRVFAGRVRDEPLAGGDLWRCEECYLLFRHPLLHSSTYEEYYRDGSSEFWESREDREDFRLVRREIDGAQCRMRVLDLGCYNGSLLASLPGNHALYGIEANPAAARTATLRGIEIIASDFEDLDRLDDRFDFITACDVIEHVPDPMDFLARLRGLLSKGGRVVLTTGDSDAWLWRLARANYWYCYFPEHISFVGRRWLQSVPPRVGLTPDQITKFNYRYRGLRLRALRPLLGAALYASAPSLYQALHRRLGSGSAIPFAPPGCGATKDHVFCVLTAA